MQLLENAAEGFFIKQGAGVVVSGLLHRGSLDAAHAGRGYVYLSPGYLRMLGYDSASVMTGDESVDLRHPDEVARTTSLILEAMAESKALGGVPIHRRHTSRIRRADGSYVWMESSAVLTPTRLYSAMCDVTDERQLRESLKTFLSITMADMLSPSALLQTASQLLSQQPCVRANSEASFLVAAITAASYLLNGIVSNGACRQLWAATSAAGCAGGSVRCARR